MSKVWFCRLEDKAADAVVAEKVLLLYEKAGFPVIFNEGEFTAVKIHFGEENNTGHIKPAWIRPLLEKIASTGAKPFLTDTNTLYKGQRQNSVDHLMQAHRHGFSIENLGVPVIIADGLLSKNFSEITVDGIHLKSVKIANDILHSESMVVLSHVTGHILSGMGAAIKNVAMGAAPRSGKQVQHADVKPEVIADRCRGCRSCIEWCPKDAIELYDGVARIDKEKCYGCAECIATCRHDAINHSFGGSSRMLQEKMAEYALGAVKNKQGKVCYITFLTHITRECDCLNEAQDKITRDIGILASYDPVAVDRAAADILKKEAGKDILRELWPDNDYNNQITHAEKIGLGKTQYKIIKLAEGIATDCVEFCDSI